MSEAGPQSNSNHLPSALDPPRVLRRKLSDNVGKYTVESVGLVKNTHRYRGKSDQRISSFSFRVPLTGAAVPGFTDFQFAMGASNFMNQFVDKVLPGDVSKLREFRIRPGVEKHANVDIMPPPFFTSMNLPFPYHYTQNIYTKRIEDTAPLPAGHLSEDEEYDRVVNVTVRPPPIGYFIRHDEYPAPTKPHYEPDMSDPQIAMIITEMRKAMDERPIWTRRGMWNRLAAKFEAIEDPKKGALGPRSGALIKHCLPFVGYQFKGGPWRDAMVRYGVDPRSDPKYRIYQTLIFKLHKTRVGNVGSSWQAVRRAEVAVTNYGKFWEDKRKNNAPRDTHIFDGDSYNTDGKVWQVCDITDPLLRKLFEQAEVRPEVDIEIAGWYYRVLWAVGKAIMKSKMLAIRFNRNLTDDDFRNTVRVTEEPDNGGDTTGAKTSISISLPDLNLTNDEREQLRVAKLRPGPPNLRRRYEENYSRKVKSGYLHRQRIKIKENERREVKHMIRLLNGSDPTGKGSGAEISDNEVGGTQADEGADDDESLQDFLEELDEGGDSESGSESGDGSEANSEVESYDGDTNIGAIDYGDEDEEGQDDDGADGMESEVDQGSSPLGYNLSGLDVPVDEEEDAEGDERGEGDEGFYTRVVDSGENSDASGYRQIFGLRQKEFAQEETWSNEHINIKEEDRDFQGGAAMS